MAGAGAASDRGGVPDVSSPAYRKATPDRLCRAVENYAELCAAYQRTPHAADFEEPCNSGCRA